MWCTRMLGTQILGLKSAPLILGISSQKVMGNISVHLSPWKVIATVDNFGLEVQVG